MHLWFAWVLLAVQAHARSEIPRLMASSCAASAAVRWLGTGLGEISSAAAKINRQVSGHSDEIIDSALSASLSKSIFGLLFMRSDIGASWIMKPSDFQSATHFQKTEF